MWKRRASGELVGPQGIVAGRVNWATTFRARRRGVIGRDELGPDEALVIWPCRRVHARGVDYPLDAVFCNGHLRVLHVETVTPARLSKRVWRARCCIELRGGRAEACGVIPGVQLNLREAS